MRATILGVSAALLLTLAPATASAAPGVQRIPVVQADLESDAGVAALYERVMTAADEVCRETATTANWMSIASCRRATVEHAIATAQLAPLTAYHEQRTSRAAPVLASR
jgi:UrcA family protein